MRFPLLQIFGLLAPIVLAAPLSSSAMSRNYRVVERGYLTDGERHEIAAMLAETFQESATQFVGLLCMG